MDQQLWCNYGLSNVSEIFEMCIYDQLISHFDEMFSQYQFGLRKSCM